MLSVFSVRVFKAFFSFYKGCVGWLYLKDKNYVTTAEYFLKGSFGRIEKQTMFCWQLDTLSEFKTVSL